MLREASWSRSNSSWGISQFKRPNDILGANSGFDQPSMIALASSRILEMGARLWKGCRPTANWLWKPQARLDLAQNTRGKGGSHAIHECSLQAGINES